MLQIGDLVVSAGRQMEKRRYDDPGACTHADNPWRRNWNALVQDDTEQEA